MRVRKSVPKGAVPLCAILCVAPRGEYARYARARGALTMAHIGTTIVKVVLKHYTSGAWKPLPLWQMDMGRLSVEAAPLAASGAA